MKALSIATAILAVVFFAGVAANFAAAEPKGFGNGANADCPNFVDEDGDGVNDNQADCPYDGDGPKDGTGVRKQARAARFVDEDGDGINDNATAGNRSGATRKVARGIRRGGANGDSERIQARDCDGSCDGTFKKTRRGVRGRR